MSLFVRLVFTLAVVFVLGLCAASVQAQGVDVPSIAYGGSGGSITGGAITRANPSDFTRLLSQNSAGTVTVADRYAIKVGASTAEMTLARAVPWGAVARMAGRAMPVVAGGMLIYDLYSALRCRVNVSGAAECDDGTDPVLREEYLFCNEGSCGQPGTATYGSAVEAFNAMSLASRLCLTSSVCYDEPTRNATATSLVTPFNESNASAGSAPVNGTYTYPGGSFAFVSNAVFFVRKLVPKCPAGGGASAPAGLDGKCPSGQYTPASEDKLAQKAEEFGDKSKAQDMFREAIGKGVNGEPFVAPKPGTLSGPGTVAGPTSTTTTTTPSGGTSTKSTRDQYNVTYNQNSYTYNTTNITNNPDGSTEETSNPQDKVEVCGLPGKPACKIDESGTGDGGGAYDGPGRRFDDAGRVQVGAIGDAGRSATGLPWTYGISIPTGACAPVSIESRIGSFTIDPCNSSGVNTLRNAFAWLWFVLSGLYLWRSATSAVGGVARS